MRFAALSIALLLCPSGTVSAQDPQILMNRLLLQKQLEIQQRFEDRQRQRYLDQQEAAYDRDMCIRAGYRGPDIEQCVRDSALWRRGYRPGQVQGPPPTVCLTDCTGGMCDTICP
jgi:hypothetical protein